MKIVLNRNKNYFCLSKETGKLFRKYLEEMGDKYFYFYRAKGDIRYRTHPALLRAIEEIGLEASCANGSKLEIFDIPEITEDTFKYYWIASSNREGYENGFEHIIDISFMPKGLTRVIV